MNSHIKRFIYIFKNYGLSNAIISLIRYIFFFRFKKINLDKRMLEAYYAVLDRLQTYNQQKQLERAKAEQGKFLDIEVK